MKSKSTAILLAVFLGGFGAHHFYLGNYIRGFLYLAFVWSFIPAFLALMDALLLMFRRKESF